ncbi:MAG TPA: copper amine oxidase N-terminal domain-containing protein, partial [Candidatus Baltobacteraceae bacterium]|nr:copper amine oxidase N-terminal domain-containing protein [Candidatus Baltobacteraceae bacterium]
PPVSSLKDGIFVPLRPVGDALGAETRYERKSGTVTVTRGDQVLRLKVGSTHAKLNGMTMTLHHAPFRVRGRVMLSLHSVEQAFGVRARFDKMTARVELETPGVSTNTVQFEAQ